MSFATLAMVKEQNLPKIFKPVPLVEEAANFFKAAVFLAWQLPVLTATAMEK